jgi:uncharacterized delta-60 repeat protein
MINRLIIIENCKEINRKGFEMRKINFLLLYFFLLFIIQFSAYAASPNDGFDPDATGNVLSLAVQTDGKIVAGGEFGNIGGQVRTRMARLNTDGKADSFDPNADGAVRAIAVQTDGKIITGGDFTNIGGQVRNRIARLNTDGTADSFNPNANGGVVRTIAVQSDGRILAGGEFTQIGGQSRNYIARLYSDGTFDSTFNDPQIGTGVGFGVYSIIVQPDGKILVGGKFTTVGGHPIGYIVRLNADGTLDTTFADLDADGEVYSISIQPDGKIIIGGAFTHIGGELRNHIARINQDGTLDAAFDPNANDTVYSTALLPDGKIIVGGDFTQICSAGRNRIARLNADGSLDSSVSLNTNGAVLTIAIQPDGKAVVGGLFTAMGGKVRNHIARLERDGKLDADFTPGPSSGIYSIAVQYDGKIYAGGLFTTIGGGSESYIARLNSDGTLDTTFNPDVDDIVTVTAFQSDGKVIIGGIFTSIGGVNRHGVARLNADGTLDTSFNNNNDLNVNDEVYAIAIQPDGKILVGGEFTSIGGNSRNYIARLNSDGTFDTTFNDPQIEAGAGYGVHSIAVQTDGKIIIGGNFNRLGTTVRKYIARLNSNGSLDTDFNPAAETSVLSIALQKDGKILVGGEFTEIGGQTRNYIARLNTDGTVDSFDPNADSTVYSIALGTDGKIVIGGLFQHINAVERNRIARLDSDGTLDNDFNPNAGSAVYAVALQSDGKVLVGGLFLVIGGVGIPYLARLSADEAALENLSVSNDGETITWMRSQSGPEVYDVRFWGSVNGTDWTYLGSGTRIAGGWELAGQSLTYNQIGYVAAEGKAYGAMYNGSIGIVGSTRQYYNAGYTLTVTKSGTGAGTVTSNPAGIDCGSDCSNMYPAGDDVILTAAASAGSTFSSWGGDCSSCGQTAACNVEMTSDRNCQAAFTLNRYTITETANPSEAGSVTCDPNPVDYGSVSVCTITANAGYTLYGAGGTCGGTLDGNTYTTNAITNDCTVIANFNINQHVITATADPSEGGSVSCDPNPVDYGSTSVCTITENEGYTLENVGGTCGGTLAGNTYTTNPITADCTVTASFTAGPVPPPPGGGCSLLPDSFDSPGIAYIFILMMLPALFRFRGRFQPLVTEQNAVDGVDWS